MKQRALSLFLIIASLACLACMCGGLDGGDILGPSASEQAQRMATHLAAEEGVPCEAFPSEGAFTVDGFSYELLDAQTVTAEDRLPWITNSDERSAFSAVDSEGLLLRYRIRNDDPVSKDSEYSIAVYTKAGDKLYAQPYNTGLAAPLVGANNPWEAGTYTPDTWATEVRMYAVRAADLEGAVLYLVHVTKEKNEHGRSVRVLHDHAVVDIPALSPGPSLVQAGEGSSGSSGGKGARRRPGR